MTDSDPTKRRDTGGDNASSSVEKAADRLSADPENTDGPGPKETSPTPKPVTQTSSIERLLDATDASAPQIIDDDLVGERPVPAEVSAPQPPPEATPLQPSDGIPESVAAMREAPEERYSNDGRPDTTVPASPYEPAHADPPPEAAGHHPENPGRAEPAIPTEPPRGGMFRRKRNDTKPWHRDHETIAETSPEAAQAATPAYEPEEQPRRRGPLAVIWSVIRYLLIGKKRQKTKPKASQAGAKPRLSSLSRSVGLLGRLRPGSVRLPLPGFVKRLPLLRRLYRQSAISPAMPGTTTEANVAGSENVGSALASRRDAAESHIRRPLDMSRRVGRSVEIDVEKIRAEGMVTPFGERTHIAEEFRLIKRPLLLNAFEKGPNAIRNGNVIMVASSRDLPPLTGSIC